MFRGNIIKKGLSLAEEELSNYSEQMKDTIIKQREGERGRNREREREEEVERLRWSALDQYAAIFSTRNATIPESCLHGKKRYLKM